MKNKNIVLIIVLASFILISGVVDLNDLFNYSNQDTPTYVAKDNTPLDNKLTNAGATLGRVLFYDTKLSVDNTISCSSCHLQEFAFGDTSVVSTGVNGVTGRHSMRLINARYSNEVHAFWDERAMSFEEQATQPIRDHIEMGYSGENGDPSFDVLIEKLVSIDYYKVLFEFAFGDDEITEERIQKALAQFVRSIESFDSKFDLGRAQVANSQTNFPNFTDQENMGKNLFFTHPPLGGAGCARCHGGTEFSIISSSLNNGVIGVANDPDGIDLTVTKVPTLRDLVNPEGKMNGPFMHDGSLKDLDEVLDHYNHLVQERENTNLDFRLAGAMHDLNLSEDQSDAIVAFLKTLTGSSVYTDEKWSDPFDENGVITVIPLEPNATVDQDYSSLSFDIYPNPTSNELHFDLKEGSYEMSIFSVSGKRVKSSIIYKNHIENIKNLDNGIYLVQVRSVLNNKIYSQKLIKN